MILVICLRKTAFGDSLLANVIAPVRFQWFWKFSVVFRLKVHRIKMTVEQLSSGGKRRIYRFKRDVSTCVN
jgi:hypothetical protein